MFSKDAEEVVQKKEGERTFFDVFYNKPQLIFLHKKTERLAAALYLVTNLLPEKEPLRWSLRQQGVALVAAVLSFTSVPRSQQESEERQARLLLTEILALLEICRHAGIFSEMNVSVLRQECEALAALFAEPGYKNQDNRARPEETALFPKDFFHITAPDVSASGEDNDLGGKEGTKKEAVVSGYVHGSQNFSVVSKEMPKDVKDISKDTKDTLQKHTDGVKDKNRNRQKSVLALLKKKSPISVKDVVLVVTDCGEKTIQRELSAMVDEGILKKSGKRRWTTYSLG